MVTALHRHRITGVAIERGDGPVVAALLDAGLTVFVIAGRQVTALRSRYGTTGNKDDRFDAYLLADVLRTDRRRLLVGVSGNVRGAEPERRVALEGDRVDGDHVRGACHAGALHGVHADAAAP